MPSNGINKISSSFLLLITTLELGEKREKLGLEYERSLLQGSRFAESAERIVKVKLILI